MDYYKLSEDYKALEAFIISAIHQYLQEEEHFELEDIDELTPLDIIKWEILRFAYRHLWFTEGSGYKEICEVEDIRSDGLSFPDEDDPEFEISASLMINLIVWRICIGEIEVDPRLIELLNFYQASYATIVGRKEKDKKKNSKKSLVADVKSFSLN